MLHINFDTDLGGNGPFYDVMSCHVDRQANSGEVKSWTRPNLFNCVLTIDVTGRRETDRCH